MLRRPYVVDVSEIIGENQSKLRASICVVCSEGAFDASAEVLSLREKGGRDDSFFRYLLPSRMRECIRYPSESLHILSYVHGGGGG